nr:MAG TPA: hypothetical protein [Caudoviricetes sp.]
MIRTIIVQRPFLLTSFFLIKNRILNVLLMTFHFLWLLMKSQTIILEVLISISV